MLLSNIGKICIAIAVTGVLISCAQSEAQQEFENEALAAPSGIVEMTANGTRVQDGENDSNDWRIGPDFSGSIAIETPAFPNPVVLGDDIEILVRVNSFQAVNGLQVYAFQQPGRGIGPLFQEDGQLETGFLTIQIDSEQFASSTNTGNFGNLYRIVLYDNNVNVISYGDVQVNQ